LNPIANGTQIRANSVWPRVRIGVAIPAGVGVLVMPHPVEMNGNAGTNLVAGVLLRIQLDCHRIQVKIDGAVQGFYGIFV
jgi:hypothetical protein